MPIKEFVMKWVIREIKMCDKVKYTKKELEEILKTRISVIQQKDNETFTYLDASFLEIFLVCKFTNIVTVLDMDKFKLLIKPNLKK